MKIRAKLTLRNEIAVAAREELGLSQHAAGDAAGISYHYVGSIERMQFKGVPEKAISLLATFYCVDPEVLAPKELRQRDKGYAATVVREVSLPMLLDFDSSTPDLIAENPIEEVEHRLDNERVGDLLREAMDTLTFREREILKLRYGLGDGYTYTLEEVGRIFQISSPRAKQIEMNGIRKLQHPARAKRLDQFVDP